MECLQVLDRKNETTIGYGIIVEMKGNESASERLRRESEELRKTAKDLMEHAAQLIAKSVELDKQIAKNEETTPDRKKWEVTGGFSYSTTGVGTEARDRSASTRR